MKFRVISDIHNEFCLREIGQNYRMPKMDSDKDTCLIIAGDLGLLHREITYSAFLEEATEQFKYVFWIAGNHEYYNGNITKDNIKNVIPYWPNLFTEKLVFEEEKIAVIGYTLWTNYNRYNPVDMIAADNSMNDSQYIRKGNNYSQCFSIDIYPIHVQEKQKIIDSVSFYKKQDYKVIVVTHHHPSRLGISEDYVSKNARFGYFSDLDEYVYGSDIDYWICGHSHCFSRYEIGKTTVICNPKGYPGQYTGFDPKLIIEL